jgi:ribosomal protein S12 methylthiotransferase
VLAVTGPHATEALMRAVHQHLPKPHDPFTDLVPPQGVRLTPDHYAYLKISEGCNHACTFCIIPALRGPLASRPIHDVMREAEALVDAGVKEILVVAQDTSAYGVDLKYRTGFWGGRPVKTRFLDLARALGELGVWIRMHYVYPYPGVDEVVELMAEGKILPYLDVPFQHASPRVLQAMKRPANTGNVLERVRRWRDICPDITIRSTFITGFPGETEEDFELLLQFLDAARLDRVGAFAYSPVEGAAANALDGMLPAEVREARRARLLAFQEDISTQRLEAKIGREMTVLVDDIDEDGEGALARSAGDAPEVDGLVIIPDSEGVEIGDFARVLITDCDVHDLYAKCIDGR